MTTTTKKATTKKPTPTRIKDPKFRVIPNLSLKGKDILTRIRNGSLRLDPSGQYSLDPEIDATRKMNRLEIETAYRQNAKKILSHKNALQNAQQKQQQQQQPQPSSGSGQTGPSPTSNKEG